MLSGETAMGQFPIEAARTMAKIVSIADNSKKRLLAGALSVERILKPPAESGKAAPHPYVVRRRKPL
jgi:pyruvate kinase